MKSLADIETALRLELQQWAIKQARNVYSAYYLYYIKATAEHDGGLFIAENVQSPEYQLASAQRVRPDATIEQNFNWYRLNVIRWLPVLS